MLIAAAKKFQDGGPAIGTKKDVAYVKLASFEGIVPKTTDWRTLGGGTTPERTEGALAGS
jgi:phthalate 4,5-dioxygenase